MAKIRFQWHVKVGDGYYAPGELIEVQDPQEYLAEGAEIVQDDLPVGEAVETRTSRRRRKEEN